MEPGLDPDHPEADTSPYVNVSRPRPSQRGRSPLVLVGLVVAVLVVGALVASQFSLLSSLDTTQRDLDDALARISVLTSRIESLDGSVAALDDELDDVARTTSDGASAAPALPAGVLPRYVEGTTDSALGMTLGPLEAPEAYSGVTVRVEPTDGRKRVWMVWAHWCPYCQEELPSLAAMHADLEATYPDIELMTVTTSIDVTRGNPLDDYLAAEAFPFPVLVDETSELAGRLGVSAFPFWVVTDGDGTVLYRSAGYLGEARVLDLMSTLDAYQS